MPVRVLALYTIDVTEQEADAAQHLPRELVVALKYANSAFARSQVDLELELADLKPFPHRRGPLLADYLKHTLCPSVSPQGQALFAERKAAAADIVVVITSSTAGDEPGWANQPDAAQADAWWPHATAVVTRVQGLQAQHNFAHEIAHVMGAGHQRTGGEPTYAHGHIWPGGRTIMATVRTRLVDYFSNPDVRLDALTSLGIPGQVDNARMLNENAPLVSTWAERAVPGTAVTCP